MVLFHSVAAHEARNIHMFLKFSNRYCIFSLVCSGFTGKHPSSQHPPGVGSVNHSVFFFSIRAASAALNWLWVTNDANVYDSVSLYEYPCPLLCQQKPLSKAHPADAVKLISEEQASKTDWCSCLLLLWMSKMSGKESMSIRYSADIALYKLYKRFHTI